MSGFFPTQSVEAQIKWLRRQIECIQSGDCSDGVLDTIEINGGNINFTTTTPNTVPLSLTSLSAALVPGSIPITPFGILTSTNLQDTIEEIEPLLGGGGDNLGNHRLTQKLQTLGHWIGEDSTPNAGLFFGPVNNVGIGISTLNASDILTVNGNSLLNSLARYSADFSGSFVARSLVDKAYVDAATPIPAAPLVDGTYTLEVVVTGGVPAYAWV